MKLRDHSCHNLKCGQRIYTQCHKKLAKQQPDLEMRVISLLITFTSTSTEESDKNDAPMPGCSGDFEFHSPESDQGCDRLLRNKPEL